MELKELMEDVSRNAIESLKQVYLKSKKHLDNKIQTRMIYPRCRNNEIRVSEQELRVIFIEELNKYLDKTNEQILFSIETPTIKKYSFGDKPISSEKGRSGNIDLVLHNMSGERIALIEFKALNPTRKNYEKDFVKLTNEINGKVALERYFIQVVKTDLQLNNAVKIVKEIKEEYTERITYMCHSLEGKSFILI